MSEVAALTDLQIFFIIEARKHIAHSAFHNKVNFDYGFTLFEDGIGFLDIYRSNDSSNPS